VQTSPVPQPSPVNRVQTTGRPSSDHNPTNGQPYNEPLRHKINRQTTRGKPKTREANNGEKNNALIRSPLVFTGGLFRMTAIVFSFYLTKY